MIILSTSKYCILWDGDFVDVFLMFFWFTPRSLDMFHPVSIMFLSRRDTICFTTQTAGDAAVSSDFFDTLPHPMRQASCVRDKSQFVCFFFGIDTKQSGLQMSFFGWEKCAVCFCFICPRKSL